MIGVSHGLDRTLHELRCDGFATLRNLAPAETLQRIAVELAPTFAAAPFSLGLFNGFRTKRFHGLFKRSTGAASLALDPAVLSVTEHILGSFCDNIQLNLTQAIEINPGELAQIPHRDEGMWPAPKGQTEYMLNVMWPLTAYTAENGGTRLWRGSHADRDMAPREEDAVVPELSPGDALIFLGSCLHGAGAHRGAGPRRGILISYCLGWLKPYENMSLTYPPLVARQFPEELRQLVGYRRHRPNLGSYEGQCPSVLFDHDPPACWPAVDALLPAQQEVLATFARRQTQSVAA